MNIANLSGYHFIALHNFHEWKEPILKKCLELDLKGSIILAPEGINFFISGHKKHCDIFLDFLKHDDFFQDLLSPLTCHISYSRIPTFKKMQIKLKQEIITMRTSNVQPSKQTRAPSIEPDTLERWITQNADDFGNELVLLDTRNTFEIAIGSFNDAINWELKKFSEFPAAFNKHKNEIANKTVVTFCTGGIRCEKAALFMQISGLTNVYQLNGGILQYFIEQQGKHFTGNCFVFDNRIALTKQLLPQCA